MPSAPLHPCGEPRCPTLVPRGQSRCPVHAKPAWTDTHGVKIKRLGGHLLQRLRLDLWAKADAKCALCGRPTLLSDCIRDHVIPLAQGTVDQSTNDGCQLLCRACSDRKTQAESLHGRGGAVSVATE